MKYTEYQPHPQLETYIDAYWTLETGSFLRPLERRIVADGCTEIFINMGISTPIMNNTDPLKPGNVYLGGPMTGVNVVSSQPNSRFIGIRFKPTGFTAFYRLPLSEIVDEIIDFPDATLYRLAGIDGGLPARLDHFFTKK